ncbi:hypothetical protein Mal15_25990 [Stieleria maiorica]|uniref:Secreted protein n=1 Tax=Stieleria maiorica TaxID=2795974 RepID=A0A5B9MHI9_9BACT|nr:hypothetical protein [Stieleria maiorica]QEF98547.1 hypothetical protein Mal15_25990 [Stieleria maiorica]
MKTISRALLAICWSIAIFALAGCGDDTKPKSMTEGVDLSEIEAYEQSVREMEAEDAGEMDDVKP